ncbi:MAG: hypothetical protein JNK49_01080, partial [Planctomycetes bacterium]|nr:hypothetical protein [Planctomycetota bacterium]
MFGRLEQRCSSEWSHWLPHRPTTNMKANPISVRRICASLTLLAAMAAPCTGLTAQIGTGVYRTVSGSANREYGNQHLGGSITVNASAQVFDSRIASTYDYARAVLRGAATIKVLGRELDVADTSAVATVRGSGNNHAVVRREFFGIATAERSTASGRVELADSLTMTSPTYRQNIHLIGPVHIEIRAQANLNLACNVAARVDSALRVASVSGSIRTWAGGTASASLSVYL